MCSMCLYKPAYLQELGELEVAEVFLVIMPKVQTDELAVPFKGNVVMHRGLAEDVPCILCSTKERKYSSRKKKTKTKN